MKWDRERCGGTGRDGGEGQGVLGRGSEKWEGLGRGEEGQRALGRDREQWEGTARGWKR